METLLLVVHLIIAIALVGVILLQKSEGGALGIGGGNGGLGSIFSARGVGNTLTRTTAWLAVAFFVTSILLTVLATRGGTGGNAFDRAQPATQTEQGGSTTPGSAQPDTSGGAVLPNLGQPAQPQVPTNQ
ncbi:MAG: preprotein translocase subunit SecG [Proteobacteria bacterium]|nr:preprotein translocase subunit SecG [Pseudomonadota bacterium]